MQTITLKHPVEFDGRTIKEITLRRPKVRDLERMDKVKGELAKSVTLIADLAEITPDNVRDLDAEDFKRVSEVIGDFLGEDGQSSSQ